MGELEGIVTKVSADAFAMNITSIISINGNSLIKADCFCNKKAKSYKEFLRVLFYNFLKFSSIF